MLNFVRNIHNFNIRDMKGKFQRGIIGLAILALLPAIAFSQQGKVPPFSMVQRDGHIFRAENLPLGKPIIIFYFSPECEECQHVTDTVISRINDFGAASIAMITYMPVETVSEFVQRNRLDRYSNIYAGTEGNRLFVLNYYSIVKFPFVALYTKEGNLVKKYYSGELVVDDLLRRLHQL